jgi:hypothetical protein
MFIPSGGRANLGVGEKYNSFTNSAQQDCHDEHYHAVDL